jgi:hypothetical protein
MVNAVYDARQSRLVAMGPDTGFTSCFASGGQQHRLFLLLKRDEVPIRSEFRQPPRKSLRDPSRKIDTPIRAALITLTQFAIPSTLNAVDERTEVPGKTAARAVIRVTRQCRARATHLFGERWQSAARDLRRTTPTDFIASPLHCLVRPCRGLARAIERPAQRPGDRLTPETHLGATEKPGPSGNFMGRAVNRRSRSRSRP